MTAKALDYGWHFSGVSAIYLQSIDLPSLDDSLIEFQVQDDAKTVYAILLTKKVDNPSWSSLVPFWKHVCLLWRELPDVMGFSQGVLVSCAGVDERELYAEVSDGLLRGRWLAQVDLCAKDGEWIGYVASFPTQYDEGGDPFPRQTVYVIVHPIPAQMISKEREWWIY